MHEPKAQEKIEIPHIVTDPSVNIACDTVEENRQAIIFVNTKRGAESQAEKIAHKLETTPELQQLSEQLLKALSTPTKQCKRLAKCAERGAVFHHAGLSSKQRDLIENAFREKNLRIICATPTLAMGVDLPAFRVIIRDLKRYGGPWGMTAIPVLEYEQQAGRAGRPGNDPWGEAICIAKNEADAENIVETYLNGKPEAIYSKLAVEPVLRTYVLSLVASEFVKTKTTLYDFFAGTFYAHQYGDMAKLQNILDRMIGQLQQWEFIKGAIEEDFVSAASMEQSDTLGATPLGKRVSELYLDPYTAHHLIKGIKRAASKMKNTFALIHLCASSLELRPYLKVRSTEYDLIDEKIAVEETTLLHLAPSRYTDEHDEYLDTIKTAMLFEGWIEEMNEEALLETFGVRPGELHAKLERMDWLVYAGTELARLLSFHEQRGALLKLRTRLKHGAKEELLPLLKLREVGRVRARKMYKSSIKTIADIQRTDPTTLAQLVGKAVAIKLKEQVGQKVTPAEIKLSPRRKGQISLQSWE